MFTDSQQIFQARLILRFNFLFQVNKLLSVCVCVCVCVRVRACENNHIKLAFQITKLTFLVSLMDCFKCMLSACERTCIFEVLDIPASMRKLLKLWCPDYWNMHLQVNKCLLIYFYIFTYASQAIISPRALSTIPTPRTVGNYSSSQAVLFLKILSPFHQ